MNIKVIMKKSEPAVLLLLAAVFTAGLMFASVEIPGAVDRLLDREIPFPDVATGQDELTAYKTELFLSHYHIRLIGYACLGLTLVLIVAGFVLEKHRLASAGAVILFLPVFDVRPHLLGGGGRVPIPDDCLCTGPLTIPGART